MPLPAASGKLTWTQITGLSTAPNGEYLASMVYDWSDHYVLFFGGSSSGHTWTFANGTWNDITSSLGGVSPGDRLAAFVTYDWADGYVLLYGGENYGTGSCSPSSGGFCGDTWTFHAGAWKSLSPTTTPSYRWRGGMTYDGADGYVLLFGGTDASATVHSDTWKYKAGTWTDITKSVKGAPPALYRQAMAYDANDSYVVMYGGALSGGGGNGIPTDLTWTYSNGTWTNITSTAGTPAPRIYTEMDYDNVTGKIVMFGGWLVVLAPPDASDTWTFSGGSWTNITSSLSNQPPALGGGSIAFDAENQLLIEMGGDTSNGGAGTIYNQTWVFGPPVFVFASANPPAIDLTQVANFTARGYSSHTPVKYAYAGLPPGCASSGSANLTCTPTSLGQYNVTIFANDSASDTSNVTILFSVTLPPSGAILIATPNPVTAGYLLHVTATASGGAKPLAYNYTGLPPGCGPTGSNNFTCLPTSPGTFGVGLNVTDSRGAYTTTTLQLTVVPAPTVSSFFASPPLIDLGQTTNLMVSVLNGAAPFMYNFSGLPLGCTTSSTTSLSCMPSATGTFTIQVNVTDASGANASATTVLGVNATPTVSSFSVLPALIDVGQSVTFTATASGGTGYLSYSYLNLPQGCAIGNASGGTCTPTQAGTFAVTIVATDTVQGNGTRIATLIVHADPAVSSTTVSRADLDLGQNITIRVHVTGGTAPFRFAYSNVPASCGAPSTANVTCIVRNQGTYVGTVTVTDAFGKTATGPVPQFSAYADPAIQSITLNPDPAVVGSSATLTVAAVQGSTVYTYNYSGLPPGCASANASQIVCTPSSTGSYVVTVTVKDSEGFSTSGTRGFNVTASNSGNGLLGLPGNDGLFLLVGIVAAAAVVGAVFLLRRRPRAPVAEEQPPAESSETVP